MLKKRTEEDLLAYENEIFEKVWLLRNVKFPIDLKKYDKNHPIHRIFKIYNDINLKGYNGFDTGYLNGLLAGLRYVLGDEKNCLDT